MNKKTMLALAEVELRDAQEAVRQCKALYRGHVPSYARRRLEAAHNNAQAAREACVAQGFAH